MPRVRSELLLKLADAIADNAQAFTELESLSCGEPLHCVPNDEIPVIVDVLCFFASAVCTLQGQATGEYLEGYTSMIRRGPLGVMASITPWNYPLVMAAWELAPTLAAGNYMVIKPSEITPLTMFKLAEFAKDIYPVSVIDVLFGHGKTAGDLLTDHEKVRMVSLAGSTATDEHIIQYTTPSIKCTYMELGEKAPVIIFDDADLDAVVSDVRTSGYYNAGQDCVAARRICAQKDIYDALVEKLSVAIASLKIGLLNDEPTELGPVSSQVHLNRVTKAVDEAKALGHIRVIAGGKKVGGSSYYSASMLLAGAKQDDAIAQREVFDPVVSVTVFDDEDQALA